MSEKRHKGKVYTDLTQLKVGDAIFIGSTCGMCSGGAAYGLDEKVTKITPTRILTATSKFDRNGGYDITYPVYEIEYFQKGR